MENTQLTKALNALLEAVNSDEPTTKRDAQKLTRRLLKDGIGPIRELLEELEEAVSSVELDAGELEEADSEDREAYHETLVASADSLHETLKDAFTSPATVPTA